MDKLLSLLKNFEMTDLLPEADVFLGQLRLWMALLVLLGPVLMIGIGAWFYFFPRTRVGDNLGFQGLSPITEKPAWDYAQKMAGMGYGIAGIALLAVFGVLCLFFGLMSPDAMATCTIICVIIELLLTLAVWLGVQFLTRTKSQMDM